MRFVRLIAAASLGLVLCASSSPAAEVVGPPAPPAPAPPPPEPARFDASRLSQVSSEVSAASAAVREGKVQVALKLLGTDVSADAGWVRAAAHVAAGRKSDAAAAYGALSSLPGVLATRAACLQASLLDSKDAEREQAWHRCVGDPVRGSTAKLELARLLVERGEGASALAALGDLPARPGKLRAEALHVRGLAEEKAGEVAQALETHRLVFIEEAASPWADRSRGEAKRLVQKLKAPAVADELLLERVDRLLAARRFAGAVAELKPLKLTPLCHTATCEPRPCAPGFPTPEEPLPRPTCAVETPSEPVDARSCRAHMLRAVAARGTRAYPKAIELGRLVYERCEAPEVRVRALFTAAAAATSSSRPEAAELAQLVGLQFPKHALADDAWMLVAAARRTAGDRVAERLVLSRLLATQPDGDQAAEALFATFWSWRAEGSPQGGLAALETLARDFDAGPRGDGGDAERGRYWLGRTLLGGADAVKSKAGVELLTTLARERPLTFFGLLARSVLVEKGLAAPDVAPPPATDAPLALSGLESDAAFAQAVELVRLGLFRDAREVLLALDTRALRDRGRLGHEAVVLVGELLVHVGDPKAAHSVVRRELLPFLRTAADAFLVRAARVAYPRMFRAHIEAATAPVGLDPDLLQGLMREESALDPRAKSPVGARGLTQVMVPTGKQVAKSLGIKGFHADMLWDPATNTRIGGAYLASMLKAFGHPGFAAAAYNAGPGNARKWLRERPPESFDAFAEEIPFSETRGYVRRVLRSWTTYRYLYGADGRRQLAVPITLPVGGL